MHAVFLIALASARCELGWLKEAEEDCHDALMLSGFAPDARADDPALAGALTTIAEIRRGSRRLPEARLLAERAVRAVAGSGDRENVLAAVAHGTLARVLRDEGRRDEAIAEQDRALAIVNARGASGGPGASCATTARGDGPT